MLDRLRWRLVERRANELLAMLRKRHGERWIQHVLQGGFHADEGMRRICEAFGLRPELERWVLRLALRKAEEWPDKASFSPSTSEDEALLFQRCEEISGGDRSSESEDEADGVSDEVQDAEDAASGASKLWRASWRLRCVLNTGKQLAPPEVLSEKDIPSDMEEEEKLSLSLREAMENAERYAAEALKEVPEAESPCEQKVESRISFTGSEICFFTIDDDGDTESGEEYTRQLRTKVFDGPSGHKARKASYCWCDEDSDSESEEDWKDQCDEMAELMGQQRQMVLWSGSWS